MHPNPAFRKETENRARALAAERGFGILSINGPEAPLSAHVPFVFDGEPCAADRVHDGTGHELSALAAAMKETDRA